MSRRRRMDLTVETLPEGRVLLILGSKGAEMLPADARRLAMGLWRMAREAEAMRFCRPKAAEKNSVAS